MKTSIERTTNGAVQFLYGDDEVIFGVANVNNVSIKAKNVASGMPVAKVPSIQIVFQDPILPMTIPYADIVNINGAPKPADIEDGVAMLLNEVFNG